MLACPSENVGRYGGGGGVYDVSGVGGFGEAAGGGAVAAGAGGGVGSTGGLASGTGIHLQNATVTFAPDGGETKTINDTIADDFGNLDGNGDGVFNDGSGGGSVSKRA